MDFSLKFGPWKELLVGKLENYPIEVLVNPEHVLLAGLIEKEGEKAIGVVLEGFKVFYALGEIERFVSALPKEITAVIKHNPEATVKFLIVSSKASYANYDEEKINSEIGLLIQNLEDNSTMAKDVSEAYGLEIKELKECPEEIREAFFAHPMLMQLLSPMAEKSTAKEIMHTSFGEIMLGVAKEGVIAKEPMKFFQDTIISEGGSPERRHAMHLLLEGCLLSGATAIILDWQNLFSGLVSPTKRAEDLRKFRIELDPMGFPVKDFFASEQVKINIATINPKGFTRIFGLGENPASKKIEAIMAEQKPETIKALEKKILEEKSQESSFNRFQQLRALRFLRLVEAIYGGKIGEKMNIEKITSGGIKGIGRASIIHLEDMDARAGLLLLDSLSNCLYSFFSENGTTKGIKAIIFLPDAIRILSTEEDNPLIMEITENFAKLAKYGIGFVIETEKENELPKQISELAEARITLVKGTDAGIHLKGQKSYRVYLRPAISSCTEL